MPEQIVKFQPNRSMYFRGFSGIDSPASMNQATANGFRLSGVFRDAAAFWVLVIYDSDDFYCHPRLKALPDANLKGIVLEYDVQFSGAQSLDSPKYPTIDSAYLDFIRWDGSVGRIDLSLGNLQTSLNSTAPVPTSANTNPTTVTSGSHTAASVTLAVDVGGAVNGDSLVLWWENNAYSYPLAGSDNPSHVASQLAAAISSNNGYGYSGNLYGLTATSSGANITITASHPGYDGNMLRLYWVATNSSRENIQVGGLATNPIRLTGGSSNVTFHVKLDFTALGIDQLRQAWLTFAPQLQDSAAIGSLQADVTFTNWGITADPNNVKAQQVAGVNSVRIEEYDAGVTLTGSWHQTNVGWFSQGFAVYSNTFGDQITIEYDCSFVHDLWVGTSVYSDRGIFGVTVDGTAQNALNMMAATYNTTHGGVVGYPYTGGVISEAISTRRQIASGISAGHHVVVLTVETPQNPPAGISSYGYCYFDFLEAVVASDVPDAPGPWPERSPAIDYDTQHGYQLPPARLLWMIEKLGFTGGPIDEYVGVFWWNQRNNPTQVLASASVDLSTKSPAVGDGIFVNIGGTPIGKSVFASETASVWAMALALYINETFSGIWASYSGSVLTVNVRSSDAAYQFSTFSAYLNSSSNTYAVTGLLTGSVYGEWVVDPTQTPALNYGAATWHADLYAQAKTAGLTVVSAFSLEIVQPPDNPNKVTPGTIGAANTWACRFPDGTPVLTGTGFADLLSTQCVPHAPAFSAYQKQAFLHLAQLQTAAGLPVRLQCGEHLWWFFAGSTGMAYYDDYTRAQANSILGQPLHVFLTPTDDPSVNNYADANLLANQLNQHVADIVSFIKNTYPQAEIEVLFANDVNGPTPTPLSQVGGKLNRYVSFPQQWRSASTAPFDVLKLEHLAFISTDRDMTLVLASLKEISGLWPQAKLRYLYTVDNQGVCQWRDYYAALSYGFDTLTSWAFDQINLIGWSVTPPGEPTSSVN